jgi:hypothetical protein
VPNCCALHWDIQDITAGSSEYMQLSPLEKLMKKFELFRWTLECDKAFDILKEKLSIAPILIFPNWEIEFHVHVDASGIAL